MKRIVSFSVIFLYSLIMYAKTGEIWVNVLPGERSDKGVIGILKNEDDRSVVVFRKDLKSGKYSFKVKEGKYLVVCMRYSHNSLQVHPVVVKGDSVTEVVCKSIPNGDLIEIKGTVVDKDNGIPIAGAKVGDYPFILPSKLLSHYEHIMRTKTTEYDLGDVIRFLKRYGLDKYLYSITDNKGRFKTFVYSKSVAIFKAINFSIFAEGYAPFYYKKRIKNIGELKTSFNIDTIELVPASSFTLFLSPSLSKELPIFLKPVHTEIASYPIDYFEYSPYKRLGVSSRTPVFVKDKFVWSFVYPWVYSVEWRIKKSEKSKFADTTSSLAVYELRDKEGREIKLDINECDYEVTVEGINDNDEDKKIENNSVFLVSVEWRGRYKIADSVGPEDLKKPIRVKDVAKGKSFIKTLIRYGDKKRVFINELGVDYISGTATTYFYTRVMMDDCAKNDKVTVKLQNSTLSFVVRDSEGNPVKDARVFAYLYKEGYAPSFFCGTRSDQAGRAVCKYLKNGEYLVFVHHSQKGYFGPETFTTRKDSYQITLKRGKDIYIELLSPEYKSIGSGFIIAALAGTPVKLFATLTLEGEKEKFYTIISANKSEKDEEKRYIAKFSNLPYQDIYLFPEMSVVLPGKGWSREAVLLDKEKEGYVQLVLGSESGTAVFEGKSTGRYFDDGYVISICKRGKNCLPSSLFSSPIIPFSTGGFVITGLSPGEYKVRLIPIDLGEGRESLETPFFKVYADQHTIVEEGSFRR